MFRPILARAGLFSQTSSSSNAEGNCVLNYQDTMILDGLYNWICPFAHESGQGAHISSRKEGQSKTLIEFLENTLASAPKSPPQISMRSAPKPFLISSPEGIGILRKIISKMLRIRHVMESKSAVEQHGSGSNGENAEVKSDLIEKLDFYTRMQHMESTGHKPILHSVSSQYETFASTFIGQVIDTIAKFHGFSKDAKPKPKENLESATQTSDSTVQHVANAFGIYSSSLRSLSSMHASSFSELHDKLFTYVMGQSVHQSLSNDFICIQTLLETYAHHPAMGQGQRAGAKDYAATKTSRRGVLSEDGKHTHATLMASCFLHALNLLLSLKDECLPSHVHSIADTLQQIMVFLHWDMGSESTKLLETKDVANMFESLTKAFPGENGESKSFWDRCTHLFDALKVSECIRILAKLASGCAGSNTDAKVSAKYLFTSAVRALSPSLNSSWGDEKHLQSELEQFTQKNVEVCKNLLQKDANRGEFDTDLLHESLESLPNTLERALLLTSMLSPVHKMNLDPTATSTMEISTDTFPTGSYGDEALHYALQQLNTSFFENAKSALPLDRLIILSTTVLRPVVRLIKQMSQSSTTCEKSIVSALSLLHSIVKEILCVSGESDTPQKENVVQSFIWRLSMAKAKQGHEEQVIQFFQALYTELDDQLITLLGSVDGLRLSEAQQKLCSESKALIQEFKVKILDAEPIPFEDFADLSADDFCESDAIADIVEDPWKAVRALPHLTAKQIACVLRMVETDSPIFATAVDAFYHRLQSCDELMDLVESLPTKVYLDCMRKVLRQPLHSRAAHTLVPFLLTFKGIGRKNFGSMDEIVQITSLLQSAEFHKLPFAEAKSSKFEPEHSGQEHFCLSVLHFVADRIKSGEFFEKSLHSTLCKITIALGNEFASLASCPPKHTKPVELPKSDLKGSYAQLFEAMLDGCSPESNSIVERCAESGGYATTESLSHMMHYNPVRATIILFSRILTSPVSFTLETELGPDICTSFMTGKAIPIDESGVEPYQHFWLELPSDDQLEFLRAMRQCNIELPSDFRRGILRPVASTWWRSLVPNLTSVDATTITQSINWLHACHSNSDPFGAAEVNAAMPLDVRTNVLAAVLTGLIDLKKEVPLIDMLRLSCVLHESETPDALRTKLNTQIDSFHSNGSWNTALFSVLKELQYVNPVLCAQVWKRLCAPYCDHKSENDATASINWRSLLGSSSLSKSPAITIAQILQALSELAIYSANTAFAAKSSTLHLDTIQSILRPLSAAMRSILAVQTLEVRLAVLRILTRADCSTYRPPEWDMRTNAKTAQPQENWKLCKQRSLCDILPHGTFQDTRLIYRTACDRSSVFDCSASLSNYPLEWVSSPATAMRKLTGDDTVYLNGPLVSHRAVIRDLMDFFCEPETLKKCSPNKLVSLLQLAVTSGTNNQSLVSGIQSTIQNLQGHAPISTPASTLACYSTAARLGIHVEIAYLMGYLITGSRMAFDALHSQILDAILKICAFTNDNTTSPSFIRPDTARDLLETICMHNIQGQDKIVHGLAFLTARWIREGVQIPLALPALLLSCLATTAFTFERQAVLTLEFEGHNEEIPMNNDYLAIISHYNQNLSIAPVSHLIIFLDALLKVKLHRIPEASETFFQPLVSEMSCDRRLRALTVEQIVSMCFTVAKLKGEDTEGLAMQRLREQALMSTADRLLDLSTNTERKNSMERFTNGVQVVTALSSFARSRVFHRGLFSTLCIQLRASRRLLSGLGVSDCILLLQGLSIVGHVDEELINKLISIIMKRGEAAQKVLSAPKAETDALALSSHALSGKLSHTDCLVALSAVAKLKIHNEEFVWFISEVILANGYESELSLLHIVLVVDSFARMNMTHSKLVRVLMDQLLAGDEDEEETLREISASKAATLLLALGTVNYTNVDAWDRLAARITEDASSISVKQVEDICEFAQRLNWRNEHMLYALGDHLAEIAENSQDNPDAPEVPPHIARILLSTLGMFLINHSRARRALSSIAAAVTVADGTLE